MALLKSRLLFLLGIFAAVLLGCEARHDPGSGLDGAFGKLEGTFQSLNANVFQPRCVKCHSGNDAPHGVDLTNYEKIMNNSIFPPLIVPGEPERSSLYKSVASGKMPKKDRRLSPAQLKFIYDWIKTGALKEPDTEPPDDGGEPPADDEPPDDGSQCEPGEPCD